MRGEHALMLLMIDHRPECVRERLALTLAPSRKSQMGKCTRTRDGCLKCDKEGCLEWF
jgi:hypothetical protein